MTTERGLKQHTPDMPCKHGHIPTYRYINSGICVECQRQYNERIPMEKRKEARAKYAAKNPTVPAALKSALIACQEWHEKQLEQLKASGRVDMVADAMGIEHQLQLKAIAEALSYKREIKK